MPRERTPTSSEPPAPSRSETSAVHSDLHGAATRHRYRPVRLHNESLNVPLTCTFQVDGEGTVREGHVIDVSATGVAVAVDDESFQVAQGATLSKLRIQHGERNFFKGSGRIVYQTGGPSARVGIRVLSGLLDLQELGLRDALTKDGLDQRLRSVQRQFERLSPEWRAAVGDLASLLLTARSFLQGFETQESDSSTPTAAVKDEVLRDLARDWSPLHLEKIRELTELSRDLDEEQVELGRIYAENQLVPLYHPGSLYRRAITKPRGYAGDYKIMLIYNQREPNGETLYERFLDVAGKQHTLSRTVVARQKTAADEIRRALDAGASKFVSLASGPAIEVSWVLREAEPPDRDVTFVLIDQDEEALAYSYDTLHRELLASAWDTSRTKIECIQLSVRQLLKPDNSEEEQIGGQALAGADMVYSMGLFDYLPDLVAQRLLMILYRRLEPGGRVFVGNLESDPNTSWLMEFVLGWHLLWRTEEGMPRLAEQLRPEPAALDVEKDSTGRCLFLRVTRPSG
jgi:extracellular factor (EF) 3-hydroxypalmitic acid methyl ester biosynthesis protein